MRKLLLSAALFGLSVGAFAVPSEGAVQSAEQMMSTAKSEAVGKLKEEEKAKLVKEAIEVVAKTQKAIALIDAGKREEAIKLLSEVSQKLQELIDRYNLQRLPVDVAFIDFNGVNDLETAWRLNREVKKVVAANDFVDARFLLEVLRNEIVIQTTYLPLVLYKKGIDLALELLKEGNDEAAKMALTATLSTLEIESVIVPKPILEAQMLIADAEKIYEKDPEGALKLLKRAEYDLKLTVALGYLPDMKAVEPLLKKIEELKKAIKEKTATAETFKGVKEEMEKVREKATTTR
jgi:hypothetical protein